jgi:hypothetical protein
VTNCYVAKCYVAKCYVASCVVANCVVASCYVANCMGIYRGRHSAICQGTLPADFGGFLYDPTRSSQRDMSTLRELPTLANGLAAES